MYYKDCYDVMVHTNCDDNINFTTILKKNQSLFRPLAPSMFRVDILMNSL